MIVPSIGSASSTVHYLEQDGYCAKDDPEHRKASFWRGRAAKAPGLGRHVSPKRFNAILQGHVPKTELRLGRMRDGEHRPGVDITLSAPKSVSLAALLHEDRRVIRAHDEAVRATLGWVEAELLQTRGYPPPSERRNRRSKAPGLPDESFWRWPASARSAARRAAERRRADRPIRGSTRRRHASTDRLAGSVSKTPPGYLTLARLDNGQAALPQRPEIRNDFLARLAGKRGCGRAGRHHLSGFQIHP